MSLTKKESFRWDQRKFLVKVKIGRIKKCQHSSNKKLPNEINYLHHPDTHKFTSSTLMAIINWCYIHVAQITRQCMTTHFYTHTHVRPEKVESERGSETSGRASIMNVLMCTYSYQHYRNNSTLPCNLSIWPWTLASKSCVCVCALSHVSAATVVKR